jgi:hypothetical protein
METWEVEIPCLWRGHGSEMLATIPKKQWNKLVPLLTGLQLKPNGPLFKRHIRKTWTALEKQKEGATS